MEPFLQFDRQSLLFFAAFVALSLGIYKLATRDPRRTHLPPHVRGWPIINQTFEHLEEDPTKKLQKWAKEYGEVFRTTSGTTTFIWLNSRKACKELIDRKSAIYSSRQPAPMLFDAASGGNRIVFMPYGKKWRSLRTIIHKVRSRAVWADFSYSLLKCLN